MPLPTTKSRHWIRSIEERFFRSNPEEPLGLQIFDQPAILAVP